MRIAKAKPIRIGNGYYFNIPMTYINNGHISPNKTYLVDIKGKGIDLSPETIKELTRKQIEKCSKNG